MSWLHFLAPVAAVAAVAGTLCSAAIGASAPLWRARLTGRGPGSTAPLAGLVLLPLAAAALTALALASPDPYVACHCSIHGMHHPHLCAAHPDLGASLLLPSLALLAAWLGAAMPGLRRLARASLESWSFARRGRRLPAETIQGVTIRIDDGGALGAFTAGVLRPVVTVGGALWKALLPEERLAVVHHEHAHVMRRDGLTLWLLRLAVALFPLSRGGCLIDLWRDAVEEACDRHAAVALGDPACVAAALLAVERARVGAAALPARDQALALGVATGRSLERRVLQVLDADPRALVPLGSDAVAFALVLLGSAVLTAAWPGDVVHHTLETAIGLSLR